jgi:hypothetical protein
MFMLRYAIMLVFSEVVEYLYVCIAEYCQYMVTYDFML